MSFLLQPGAGNQSPPEQIAARIKGDAKTLYRYMVASFVNGAKDFWTNSVATPAEIAEALGPDAVEVFSLHAKLGALLAEVNPAAIAAGAAVVGEFEYNEDGTVTVIEE
jgi:hypothetical protein